MIEDDNENGTHTITITDKDTGSVTTTIVRDGKTVKMVKTAQQVRKVKKVTLAQLALKVTLVQLVLKAKKRQR